MSRQSSTRTAGQRRLRVGEELRHALSLLMERTNFRDPDLVRIPVTVTEVRVSPDLRSALVFVVPLGGGDSVRLLASLKRIRPFFRHALARMVPLQFVPDLSFRPDNCFEMASHIEQILHRPEVQRDLEVGSLDVTLDDLEPEEHNAKECEPGKTYEENLLRGTPPIYTSKEDSNRNSRPHEGKVSSGNNHG